MIWSRGIKNPPHKIKVKAVMEGGIVKVELADYPEKLKYKKLREEIGAAAIKIVKAVKYHGAGTVEFLLDKNNKFYFIIVFFNYFIINRFYSKGVQIYSIGDQINFFTFNTLFN